MSQHKKISNLESLSSLLTIQNIFNNHFIIQMIHTLVNNLEGKDHPNNISICTFSVIRNFVEGIKLLYWPKMLLNFLKFFTISKEDKTYSKGSYALNRRIHESKCHHITYSIQKNFCLEKFT